MSIAIITAAHAIADRPAGLPREVISQLVERAGQAGRTVAIRSCRSAREIADCLRRMKGDGTQFVLLDPGPHALAGNELEACLSHLAQPGIEVHAHRDHATGASCAWKPISVIDGYGAQGYVLALSIALEYLGCAECENDVHVGT